MQESNPQDLERRIFTLRLNPKLAAGISALAAGATIFSACENLQSPVSPSQTETYMSSSDSSSPEPKKSKELPKLEDSIDPIYGYKINKEIIPLKIEAGEAANSKEDTPLANASQKILDVLIKSYGTNPDSYNPESTSFVHAYISKGKEEKSLGTAVTYTWSEKDENVSPVWVSGKFTTQKSWQAVIFRHPETGIILYQVLEKGNGPTNLTIVPYARLWETGTYNSKAGSVVRFPFNPLAR